MNQRAPHKWTFFRAGGFDQVKLETGADLMNLDQLDQKLWVALACPTAGLEFDPLTAKLLDGDDDGRIRAPEVIAAARWAGSMLAEPTDLVKGGDRLPLAAISAVTPEGKLLLASARQILRNLGSDDVTAISVAQASDANKIFANTTLNGDGIIIPETAEDATTKNIINDVITCQGAVTDRSGKPGIDQARADAFFVDAKAFAAWHALATADADQILPAGAETAAAAAAVAAVKAKVDDFFGRCRLAAFDPRTLPQLNRSQEEYLPITSKDLSRDAVEVAGFPLALVAAGKALPLTSGLNPAHAAAVEALRARAVTPLLGPLTELSEANWTALLARLDPWMAWTAAKAGASVEPLGLERVQAILGGQGEAEIGALIAKDKALEGEANAIANVEKLCRYVRDLHVLLTNFVNFKDLYDDGGAIFQVGTLYLDQRSCTLCLAVGDVAQHATMAGLAGAYLAYCDCVRSSTGEKRSIVAVVSQGDDDNLMVGRNGIFYDRQGRDYDATITKIVSNPISLRQAFWAPYKKLVRLIDEQVSKRAAAADAEATTKLQTSAELAANVDKVKPDEPKKATITKIDVGAVAAMGVAFGALSAALAGILGLFKGIAPWQFPLLILIFVLAISTPSLVLAWSKLRRRNLGPLLDAGGWAVNAKSKVNVPFGTRLTGIARLPPGSVIDASDRYAEKTVWWPKVAGFAFVVWWIGAFASDMGLLWRLTKDWETPLGAPPTAVTVPHAPTTTTTTPATPATTTTPAQPTTTTTTTGPAGG